MTASQRVCISAPHGNQREFRANNLAPPPLLETGTSTAHFPDRVQTHLIRLTSSGTDSPHQGTDSPDQGTVHSPHQGTDSPDQGTVQTHLIRVQIHLIRDRLASSGYRLASSGYRLTSSGTDSPHQGTDSPYQSTDSPDQVQTHFVRV